MKGRLVITRKTGERFFIGDQIVVTMIEVEKGKARLMIEAPKSVRIDREELRVAKDALLVSGDQEPLRDKERPA